MSEVAELSAGGPELVFAEPGFEDLWAKLEGNDPERVALLTRTRTLGGPIYLVEMLGAEYLFNVPERRITGPRNRPAPDKRAALCLLNYLAGAREGEAGGRMVPETVLPGGERFFTGGHALTRKPILDKFGRDGAALLDRARALGAEIIDGQGDGFSFRLNLLPRIAVQVTLSEDDDEFPAEVYYAFDASAADLVPLGILSALITQLNTLLVTAVEAAQLRGKGS